MNGWWDDGSLVVCCYENGPLNVLTPHPSHPLSLSLPIRMELCGMCVCRCHCLIRSHVIHNNNSRRETKVMMITNIDCALMLCCCFSRAPMILCASLVFQV
jgi:hypothetical protein